jgi:transposase
VGPTKRGKGSKIMALTDRAGLPLAAHVASASPHEISLVEATLDGVWTRYLPEQLIGDKAYDSDPLDDRLHEERNVELIAPHRSNRKKQPTQDGRPLRRYKRRWKVERLFAWLHNFRRLVIRYEYHLENFRGMVLLGCIMILLRRS